MARAVGLVVALAVTAGQAVAQQVVIVQGTVSHASAGERNFARRATEAIDRTLREFGLEHAVIPDEAVSAARLKPAAVVILPYNAILPADELGALRSFVNRGGKLIVFYSSDAGLAQLMGFKLGPYQPMAVEGQWAAFRFLPGAPDHVPPRLTQTSRNIRPAQPARADARVIAVWENRAGVKGSDPAWVQSPQGFWMSHLLDDDGDARAQAHLLLALLGHCAPELWKTAATSSLAQSARFRQFTAFAPSLDWIAQRPGGDAKAVTTTLDKARQRRALADGALADARYPEAITLAAEAHRARVDAYALTFPVIAGERRGVWDHGGAGLYPGDWERTARILASHGITDLFINVLWPGVAHYPSDVVPRSDTVRVHGDQVAACLAAARPKGLRVHAWKICWRLEPAPPELVSRLRNAGRLQVTDTGETLPWLCPSHPDNLQYEKDAVRELLTRYDVNGVHLDYIRYRDSHVCFCKGCRRRFEAHLKQKVADWPRDVKRAPLQSRFEDWRAGRITRLVADVRTFGRRLRPDLEVSAAVYGRYPLCIRSVGQDWGQWVEQGHVDLICPMNYNNDPEKFAALCTMQAALPGAAGRLLPGIGVTAAESRLDAVAVLDQIAIARQAGASGYVLFDLNHTLEENILPVLALTTGATQR